MKTTFIKSEKKHLLILFNVDFKGTL